MELKRINDKVSVAGQIALEDLRELKAQGFSAVINNRPDGEAPDQPTATEIEAAALEAGLAYHFIPLGRDGVSQPMIEATREALDAASGPVLSFCRTGTRSTTLWALAQAGRSPAEEIVSAAAEAGYDISHLHAHLAGAQE
jgi:uncharacterized protein (TIGR01244 family)